VTADSKDTSKRTQQLFYRQSAWTRVTHWIWAVTLFFMVASGLQIFNAHPILYVGRQSGFGDKQYLGPQAGSGNKQFNNTVLDIHAAEHNGTIVGVTDILGHDFDTTGFLGKSESKGHPIYQLSRVGDDPLLLRPRDRAGYPFLFRLDPRPDVVCLVLRQPDQRSFLARHRPQAA
jgi:hypothetical protein